MEKTKKCIKCNRFLTISHFEKNTLMRAGKQVTYHRQKCKSCRISRLIHTDKDYIKKSDYRNKLEFRCWNYGITTLEYNQLLELQNNKCAICYKEFYDKTPAIDHCHTTHVVRGLLCKGCNTALGGFKDSLVALNRAQSYLLTTPFTVLNETKETYWKNKGMLPAVILKSQSKKTTIKKCQVSKKVYLFSHKGQLINTYENVEEAITLTKYTEYQIKDCVYNKRIGVEGGKYKFTFEEHPKIEWLTKLANPYLQSTLYQYDMHGNLVQCYNSVIEAVLNNPLFKKKGIEKVLYGELKTYKGFYWTKTQIQKYF